jgi:hypothetical protein
MNARETTLITNAIEKRKALIKAQMQTKKSERNQRDIEDAYQRIANLKSWLK